MKKKSYKTKKVNVVKLEVFYKKTIKKDKLNNVIKQKDGKRNIQ